MHSAIVYYSLEGNVRTAVTKLAQLLDADVFEIRTTKTYPKKGLGKFLVGGKDSAFGLLPKIEPLNFNTEDYSLVVLALPVWAGKAAAPINSFLKGRSFGKTRVAFLISSASGDAESCEKDLAGKLGKSLASIPVLSLKDPGKMPEDELTAKLTAFVEELQPSGGGGGAF